MNNKAKRFAIWFALNKSEVHFYSREPSYYGGSDIDPKEHEILKKKHGIGFSGLSYELPTMLQYIKSMGGIDYEKTQAPVSREVSQFSNTFNEPDVVEFLSGVFVLISGEAIPYYAFSKCNLEDYYKAMELFKLLSLIDEFEPVEKNETA